VLLTFTVYVYQRYMNYIQKHANIFQYLMSDCLKTNVVPKLLHNSIKISSLYIYIYIYIQYIARFRGNTYSNVKKNHKKIGTNLSTIFYILNFNSILL